MPEYLLGEIIMKTKSNLWSRKRNTFLMLIVIAMIVAISISFISFFRTEEVDETEEITPYDSMYNASRYFFRVFYPDDWDVNSDPYGFLLDDATGLVLEVFPLRKMAEQTPGPGGDAAGTHPAYTPSPSPSASASPDPREGMERDHDLTISFYYRGYDEILKSASPDDAQNGENGDDKDKTNTPSPEIPAVSVSPTPDGKQPPVDHETTAEFVFENFKSAHKDDAYKFSNVKEIQTENMNFTVLPYEYVQDDLKMSGELYVATRAMAYYIIQVDGTASAFARTQPVVQNILYNIVFSVFEY